MATPTRTRPQPQPEIGTGHRPDLLGLAALAVLPLLLAGAGLDVVPGGPFGWDVLFVLAGFLVTALLLGEWHRAGQVTLTAFYARCARRLLPTAVLVLAASVLLVLTCLPRSRWPEAGWDLLAAGLGVLNWRLAAQDAGVPVAPDATTGLLAQHWALGVGAQFLVFWPVLLAGVAVWAVRRDGRDPRRPLLYAAGLLVAGSLGWAVLGASPGAPAFFGTHTRAWEPALGAGLALLALRPVALPRWVAAVLGWGGLVAIAVAVLAFRPGPGAAGSAALLPALGAAAVILSRTGRTGTAGGGRPVEILASRPVRAAGQLCYGLYLWYWPLLAAAHARFGELPAVAGLAVLGGAVLLAALTRRHVETPLRTGLPAWSPAETLRIAALVPAAVMVGGLLLQLGVWPPRQVPPPSGTAAPVTVSPSPSAPAPARGAAVLRGSPSNDPAGAPVARVRSISPKPADAGADLPEVYRHNCFSGGPDGPARACVYGDRNSAFTVALAGDSHAASWVPALRGVAEAKGWRLITYLRPGCPFLDLPVADAATGRPDAACAKWYANVRAELTGPERPALLLTTGHRYPPSAGGRTLTGRAAENALVEGMRRTWAGLVADRVRTVVLRDTPVPGIDVPKCVSKNPERLTRCAPSRRTALAAGAGTAQAEAVRRLDDVPLIDLNGAICPTSRCAPVIGGVLVYRDARHLTASYAQSLSPRLGSALERVVGQSAP
ncbi:acyltransferase family protein [Plantactinospora sonchi]|uniref:Acyltransferase family protein n=1 Tax=Plantactinospora sonchi TaxID=1544735 RepID=A0ABU7S4A3_9ACTN